MPILSFVQYVPSKEHIRFRSTLKVINKFAKDLINEKTEAVLAGKNENKRDMMSILGTRSPSSLTADAHGFLPYVCAHSEGERVGEPKVSSHRQ